MKIAILGYGQYGQALGSLLTYNHVDFTPVDVDMPLTHTIDMVLQAVPTQFIVQAFQKNKQFFTTDTIIVNLAKGIEKENHQLPYQLIERMGYHRYYSLIGPSFAAGIVKKDPTLVSLGYTSDAHLALIKQFLQTPYFRLQPTLHYQAIELSGAMKNVYAILCGYANGLGFGPNTQAKIITIALQEIQNLGKAMKLQIDLATPGIVGDLVLTCSSSESRNYQFGKNLATMQSADALLAVGSTVEGYHTSASMVTLSERYKVKLPAALLVQRLITEDTYGHTLFDDFVQSL